MGELLTPYNPTKICILASYYVPEITATTYLTENLAVDFNAYGADVTVVCSMPNRLVDPAVTEQYMQQPTEQLSDTLKILRVGTKKYKDGNLFFRGLYHLYRSYVIYRAASKVETDVYLICSGPFFNGLAGMLLKRKAPTVYVVQDVFPDNFIYSKGWRNDSIIVRLLRLVEKAIYACNTHLVTVSDDIRNLLIDRRIAADKISVVYDWFDEHKCVPIKREANKLLKRFKLDKNKFYVSYAGNIGLLQNLETLVEAAELLKDNNDIRFIIIGDGAKRKDIEQLIAKKNLENIKVFPMQPVEDVAHVYSLGDIGLVSIKPGVTKIALPSKTWTIMSAARPIICEVDLYSRLCKIIEENEFGKCVAPSDATGLVKAIVDMYENKEQLPDMGKRARKYIEDNLTRSFSTQKYYETVLNIIRGERKCSEEKHY